MAKHNTIMTSVHTNGTLPSKTCAEFVWYDSRCNTEAFLQAVVNHKPQHYQTQNWTHFLHII